MKAVLTAVFAVALLAGCSSDPTAKDFERFAMKYAEDATGATTGGHHRELTLVRHNLRKTDSLTVPFVGEAEYAVKVTGVTFVHPNVPRYSTPAVYHNTLNLSFGHVEGEWQPQGGDVAITSVDFPELDAEQINAIDYIFLGNIVQINREMITEHRVALLNPAAMTTVEELKQEMDLP